MNDHFITTEYGYRLAITEIIHPDAPITAIILHGFQSDRKSGNSSIARDALVPLNLNIVTLDFYGRGESDGTFGNLTVDKGVENVEAVVNFIHQRDPQQKIILIGGSFGGLVALHSVAILKDVFAQLILRAPVSDWGALWRDWVKPENLQTWTATGSFTGEISPGVMATFGPEFLAELQHDDLYDTIAPQITIPTLIVHGDQDETVPLAHSEKLQSVLPDSQLFVLPGADHRFSRAEDIAAYQRAIQNFIQSF